MKKKIKKKETFLKNVFYMRRYESESGNFVWDGKVFNGNGNFICKFTLNMAKNYHRMWRQKEII